MKKRYISPDSIILNLQVAKMISTSNDVSSNNGIGYGGIDTGGDKEPAAKEFLWDNSEE